MPGLQLDKRVQLRFSGLLTLFMTTHVHEHPGQLARLEIRQALMNVRDLIGSPVTLRVFDAGGRLVRTLIDGPRQAGAQSAVWDGRNDSAAPAASGVYFYRLQAAGFEASERMVLTK